MNRNESHLFWKRFVKSQTCRAWLKFWNHDQHITESPSHRVTESPRWCLFRFCHLVQFVVWKNREGLQQYPGVAVSVARSLGRDSPKKNHFPTNNWSNAVPFQTFTSFFDNVIYLSLFIFKRNPISSHSHPFQLLFKHFNLLQLNFHHFQPRGNSHLLDRDVVWTVGCGGKLENILPHHWILFLSLFYGFLALVDWAYEIISMWEDGGFWQNCWWTFP